MISVKPNERIEKKQIAKKYSMDIVVTKSIFFIVFFLVFSVEYVRVVKEVSIKNI